MSEKKRVRLRIDLEVEGDEQDALHVVDTLLDAGFFQDAINEHDVEDAGELRVKSIVVRGEPSEYSPSQEDE